MDKVEKRFLEVAQNKDITDESLFEEICYLYAKSQEPYDKIFFERFKHIRKSNPYLTNKLRPEPDDAEFKLHSQIPQGFRSLHNYSNSYVEKYEMKQRIQTLEQTLATFMEQTKVERLAQEATIQSISNELDEFQEEFYDCQSDVQEQKEQVGLIEDALRETIEIVQRLELEIHKLKERIPFVKDKMA
jgi:chromosome segregation ATPase